MNWNQTKLQAAEKLRSVLELHRHAKALANLATACVPPALIQKLDSQVPVARRQLDRLTKNEFRMGVVGLEKAGKSTFVNAWLGCDLLPTALVRCTYTPTQIYSVTEERQQRLEVLTKTHEEFDRLICELKASSTKEAAEDLSKIEQHRNTLDAVIEEGNQIIPFLHLEEIRPYLQKYVADERFAHAIREVRLYTTQLAAAEGVVFYDVPGMDSGLAKTLEDNRQMLEDSDAIIVVMRDPSLKGSEKDLVRMAVSGDAIPISEKLFVFLGRADTYKTAEAWRRCQQEAKTSWASIGHPVHDKRFLSGSAGAHLRIEVPNLREETEQTLGPRETMLTALRMVSDCDFPDEEVAQFTGIPAFKNAVQEYLNTDRSRILLQRCDTVCQQIEEASREILAEVARRVPSDPDELRQQHDFRRRDEFSKWWGDDNSGKWMHIRVKLNDYRKNTLLVEETDQPPRVRRLNEWVQQFKRDFVRTMAEIPSRQENTRRAIFDSSASPAFVSATANHEWRAKLYPEILQGIEKSAERLAVNLHALIEEIKNYIRQELLWNSQKVDIILSDLLVLDKGYLQNALKVLFLRYARPLADILVRAPLGSAMRENRLKAYRSDTDALISYLDRGGLDPAFHQPHLFAKHGLALLIDPSVREKELLAPKSALPDSIQRLLESTEKLQKEEKYHGEHLLVQEVEGDLIGLELIITEGLLPASGFGGFCYAEVQSLIDIFFSRAHRWSGLAGHEWQIGNPEILKELPASLQTQEIDLEACQLLANLKEALANYSLR
jgi:hypothetical protein